MIVLWTVALVLIMVLVAVAIDLGNIAQTKQHAENAAADAALSAVSDLTTLYPGSPDYTTQEAQAVLDAEAYLTKNYSSLASANFATGCTGKLPSGIYIWPSANCFGFFNQQDSSSDQTDPTGMAVAIPTQQVSYTFGKVGGLTSQAVSGLAYASIQISGSGLGIPFSYSFGAPNGLQCLKTGSGNKAGSCTGFATGSGNFAALNSPRYQIYAGSSPSGGNSSVIETDLELGIDHGLNVASASSVQICDAVGSPPSCTEYNNTGTNLNSANWVNPQTGQTQTDITPPLFTGGVPTPDGSCTLNEPRFAHADGFGATGSCSADSNPTEVSCYSSSSPSSSALPCLSSANGDTFGSAYPLNGVNISYYLNSTGQALVSSACPTSLDPSTTAIDAGGTGSGNVWISYDGCLSSFLQSYSGNSPIFSSDILNSPRFGIVPAVASSSGTNAEQIKDFLGVFLDLAFGSNNKVSAILAWVFPWQWIDQSSGKGLGFGGYHGGPYVINLCSFSAGNC